MQWRVKKECYKLTWFARLILLFVFVLAFYFTIKGAYSFLSPQKPVTAKVLVVEGWLNDYALEESLDLFRKDSYDIILITGGPLNTGYVIMDYSSTADVSRATMLALGGPADKIVSVNRELVWRDRTYQSALALKKYMKKEMPHIKTFNLVSLGAHSRRSWLLFQKAMPNHDIGIISLQERLYAPDQWWKTSKGFRTIFTEAIGCFYVLLFFSAY